MTNIVEAKVKTSTAAAAATGLVLGYVSLWVYGGEAVPDAVADYVTMVLTPLVTGGITYAAGWLTKHTPRVDIDATEAPYPTPRTEE